jgi:hypothetical protein
LDEDIKKLLQKLTVIIQEMAKHKEAGRRNRIQESCCPGQK